MDVVCSKDGGSANFPYWLLAESWGSVLPCQRVRGESDIFELWFRIDRGCRVFGNMVRMSRGPGRTILCGLNRAQKARCGTPKFRTEGTNDQQYREKTGNWRLSGASAAGLLAEG
jgi:hypothetical protein